jgi:ectoine hydroxylase-related dioxygenase (phytanoyl-CoA dioxygenase family)
MAQDLQQHLEEINILGYTLVENVLTPEQLENTRQHMNDLQQAEIDRYGKEKLLQIRELGTLRFMMAADRYFLNLIAIPAVLEIMEALLGPACILHLQNGIILLPKSQHQQSAYHQDYRRWMNGYTLSYNAFFLIDDFTHENGGTYLVPATHTLEQKPSDEFLEKHTRQITGQAGTILFFNSRLWHRGGDNLTDKPRRAINTQYTHSYLRQQVDYAHCLPEDEYATLPERVQQLLGRFVRLPKSTDEFRVPPEERLYRAGQG